MSVQSGSDLSLVPKWVTLGRKQWNSSPIQPLLLTVPFILSHSLPSVLTILLCDAFYSLISLSIVICSVFSQSLQNVILLSRILVCYLPLIMWHCLLTTFYALARSLYRLKGSHHLPWQSTQDFSRVPQMWGHMESGSLCNPLMDTGETRYCDILRDSSNKCTQITYNGNAKEWAMWWIFSLVCGQLLPTSRLWCYSVLLQVDSPGMKSYRDGDSWSQWEG